jgi:threonine synthase
MDDLINRQVINAKERTVVIITGTGVKSASLIAELLSDAT